MLNFFQYLLEASGIIALLYGCFRLGFSRLNQPHYNRALLVGGLLLAIAAPLIHIPVQLPFSGPSWETTEEMLPLEATELLPFVNTPQAWRNASTEFAMSPWLQGGFLLYVLGFMLTLLYKGVGLVQVWNKIKGAAPSQNFDNAFLTNNLYTFSFGKKVFLGADFKALNHTQKEMVLSHELAHAQQLHGIDLLLLQLTQCIFWFNPLLLFWGRELRQQHEYLADQAALRQFQSPKAYAQLLLKMSMTKPSPFTHHFAFFPLKKRVTMLFKTNTQSGKWAYLLMLPLAATLLCSFSFFHQTDPPKKPATTQTTQEVDAEQLQSFIKPVDSRVVSHFGMRYSPISKKKKMHNGVDLHAAEGTDVVAVADGIVTVSEEKGNYGLLIAIEHADNIVTRYAHLADLLVPVGQKVKQGDIIALSGNTGVSTAPHLHYEVIVNGEYVDPRKYFEE
ncbi:MAG: M23/M56 family metallopeptidase [Bacteroidia bacterium]